MAFGWRLGDYYNSVDKAYCGWFISDYGTPRWIGADNGTWKSGTFAFLSSNVASATKLQTARTLWGQSFNGTENVSGNMTGVGSITASGNIITSANLGINTTAGSGLGISLYGGANYVKNYGIMFATTKNFGTHGYVTSDWATYLTMDGAGARGWIFRHVSNGNKASISADGNAQFQTVRTSNWLRSTGATGWYNESYGGGWYMTDTTWIRNYNNKSLYMNTGIIRTDYLYDRQGYAGSSWNNGYGAYNVAITNDGGQTPLMVAYRAGQNAAVTGANRLFALELLNLGTLLHFGFGGASKFDMNSLGVFHAVGGIYSDGYVSARGQNTSDIRLKTDIRDFRANDIIKALRPVQFKWNATARSKFPVLDTDATQYGLIAQEAEKTAPWLVDRKMFDDDYWGVRYDKLIPVLLKGQQETIRDLMKIDNSLLLVTRKTETLEQRVTRLEAENRELKTQISQLKTQLA